MVPVVHHPAKNIEREDKYLSLEKILGSESLTRWLVGAQEGKRQHEGRRDLF